MPRMRWVAAGVWLVLSAGVAGAQSTAPTITADCDGVDHPPFDGELPADDPSYASILRWYGTLADAPPDVTGASLTVEDGSGVLHTATGTIDDQGRVGIVFGVDRYDSYDVRGPLRLSTPGGEVPVDGLDGRRFPVGPAERPCTREQLPPGTFAAAPTTTTTQSTTTTQATTTTEPATTTTQAATTTTTEPRENEGSFRMVWVLPIVVGAILILVGGVTYHRTRERTRTATVDGGPDVAPPVAGAPVDDDGDDREFCDWGVQLYDPNVSSWYWLREPEGEDCCVIKISISSTWEYDVETRRTAYDDEHALLERMTPTGLDISTAVGARVTPTPSGATADAAVRQTWAHELHLWAQLESRCPGGVDPIWRGTGYSSMSVDTSTRCANESGDACPVDTHVGAGAYVWARGDMYWALATPGFDLASLGPSVGPLDVLPGSKPEAPEGVATRHGHDAEGGQRSMRWSDSARCDDGAAMGNGFELWLRETGVTSAAATVPAGAMATTDQAAAEATVVISHEIDIWLVTEVWCYSAPCHGKRCRCKPALRIVFRDGNAWIEVDETSHRLEPPIDVTGPGETAMMLFEGYWMPQ